MAVLAISALVTMAAGCGQDATARPTPTSAPAIAPTLITPTHTPLPPSAALAPTALPTSAPDSDSYFSLDRVLDIEIEIAAEDWDTLRHQTRTFGDLMAEIEEYGLSRPFANIYTWFSGTVTVDGETHSNVGVRKKGFIGSQSDTKPSLKLRFDKYVDDQSLGGIIERMTLNNSIQDTSMVNTCLAYRIFAAAGSPSPRCNFATVTVNGKNLGLYVHVEEIKKPFLARHFSSAEGNQYEGTVSDFTADYRGTLEKKSNEDADDWSDIDAVVSALRDPSAAGLEALAKTVDLDRFLSFWATEVIVGHWDGYAGNRNNYRFYREPGGAFVFIPWGVDGSFHLKDDPNPFDNISNPPPSVLALSAIPSRLYGDADWRLKYVDRLKELLDTVWNEDELLEGVDRMATIIQKHALPEARSAAAENTSRVRKFILKRRGEILADITPEPPDWPKPEGNPGTVAADTSLVINEVAAKGDPLDWFELYNASDEEIPLAGFVVSDDLKDAAKRVAFPDGLVVPQGGYLKIELDKDGWPGFALGGDEELGIWTVDGELVDEVDWDDGQAGEGMSYARVPDASGDFQTVGNPTPGKRRKPDPGN